jgi:uncharacterized protein YwqG
MPKKKSLLGLLRRIAGKADATPNGESLPTDADPIGNAQPPEDPPRHALLLVRAGLPVPEEYQAKSFMGGLPRMPSHLDWPSAQLHGEMQALTFIAQVDLAELPAFPQRDLLPAQGTLYFFVRSEFDGVENPVSKVLYFNGDSTDLAASPPPGNLMVFGGGLHYSPLYWLDEEKDPRGRTNFKYPLSFAVTESYADHTSAQQLDAWQAALAAKEVHNLDELYELISPEDDSWPFNWAFVEHVSRALAVRIEHRRDRMKSLPAEAGAKIEGIAAEAIHWAEAARASDAFAPPSAAAAQEFRTWWRERRSALSAAGRDAGFYDSGTDDAFKLAARYVVRLTCAQSAEAQQLIPRHYLQAVQAETIWRRPGSGDIGVNMSIHQMFGYGEPVQSAPSEHSGDLMLLQVKGDPGLAWHDNIGCALQLWLSREALRELRLSEVVTTLECD